MAIRSGPAGASRWDRLYLPIALFLVAGGLITSTSIGFPFALLGLGLLVLRRWRQRRSVFIPAILGLLAFILVAMLLAPLGCTSSGTAFQNGRLVAQSFTTCDNLLGLGYEGAGDYRPSYLPALVGALGAAGVAAAVSHALIRRRESR